MADKIRLDNITKRFGDVVAVDGVTASFEEGAYTMILGPSGSGKSTLLRIIAGLETPTEGTVSIDGRDVTDAAPKDRELSMVFQNLALWDHKTVRENMAFGLQMEGVDSAERRDRVEEIAELLQIEDKLDANPTELSGGQQQRVALGRSLVRRPDVVLLDEPLASLDQRLRLEMRTELKRIQQETGTTFVHVTHNQEDAMTVADEILLINGGTVEQFAGPLELYHTPANEFVADFIGSPSINLFDATFGTEDGAAFDLEGDIRFRIPEEAVDRFRDRCPEGTVRVGIRPEAFEFVDDGATEPAIDGTVSLIETFGDSAWYYLDVGGEEIVVQSGDESVLNSVSVGDGITVAVAPDSIHTFDIDTRESLGTATVSEDRQVRNARQ